ncbi:MAG: LL-diaminopimelate aminotransferase [Verrucomicrobia bacterium]|nr:LL-diaminopimelate aminotransferase [Verrucomicrobiota bacterium]MCG2679968.1 LL-diaminopimelate aminotransferase [Kiritimatiellia bacterium]MBU4247089.1 LL-diaminopimelate aminotransferase [Verrucomicrobiota bacterium]MBU4290251.1 LL-diaminopimelate aminotransferase [Verrucomicrobiota bacterium]MBU4428140.1 LL-diaminopimelate aminotransferase [Verrucomicrobiota bacterium]
MDLQKLFAERIGGAAFGLSNEIYKFEKIKRAKAAACQAYPGVELLDFGVGEPDRLAPTTIRRALKKAVDDPANRGYADNGIREFKVAAVRYMQEFFGVTGLDPDTEINHSIGSKPALAMMPLCFINPGDVALVTVPGYPVLATHTRYLGGEVVKVPLTPQNGFFPDLNAIDAETARRAKLFYVNYPNNPTGAAATEEIFDRLIAFARQYNILIVQDAAYATLVYGRKPLSILSRPGGMDAAVELHSMSKSFNMTGWRLGFVAGSARVVQAYAEVKDNMDSGQFKAIQLAACAGIAEKALADRIVRHYQRRLRKMVKCLCAVGFNAHMPGGTFYLYLPAPKGAGAASFAKAEDASQHLIREHLISTVPWDDGGAFLRFSATFESAGDQDDDRVIGELKLRLEKARLRF